MIGPLNILLIILFLIVVPFILGVMYEGIFDKSGESLMISRCFAMGMAIMLASFQIIAVPLVYKGTSFSVLFYVATAVFVIIIAISLALNLKTLKSRLANSIKSIVDTVKAWDRETMIIWIAALLMIAFQTSLLIFKMHTDTDDARFLAEAVEAIEKNTLLKIHPITGETFRSYSTGTYYTFPYGEMFKEVTSPYPLLISVLSIYTRVHPTIIAHAVFPVLFIPMCYVVLYMLGTYFFKGDSYKISVYMFIISVLILFSFESVYTWGYTLLTIIWQGRSISAVIMLPLLWYVLMKIYTDEDVSKGMYLVLLTVALANSDLSGMGATMSAIIGGVFALCTLIRNKRFVNAVMIGLCIVPSGLYMIMYEIIKK